MGGCIVGFYTNDPIRFGSILGAPDVWKLPIGFGRTQNSNCFNPQSGSSYLWRLLAFFNGGVRFYPAKDDGMMLREASEHFSPSLGPKASLPKDSRAAT